MMISRPGRRGAQLFAAALFIAVSGQAMAMPKEQGSYDCSCKGGSGTCTFKSASDNISCGRAAGDTCSGKCQLSTAPDSSGSATRGSVKSGPIGGGGGAAAR